MLLAQKRAEPEGGVRPGPDNAALGIQEFRCLYFKAIAV